MSSAAKAAFAAGDYYLAVSLFTTLIDDGAADDRHLQLCNRSAALLKLGRPHEAAADARLAVTLSPPDFVKGHYRLACALQAEGELDEALETCRAALRVAPDHPQLVALAQQCAAALASPTPSGSRVQITSCRPKPAPGAPLPAPRPLAQAPAPAWPLLWRLRCQLHHAAHWLCHAVLPIGLARRWLGALPLPRSWLFGADFGAAVAPASASAAIAIAIATSSALPAAAAAPLTGEPVASCSALSTLDADAFDACMQQMGLCDLLRARSVSHAWATAARRALRERWGGFRRAAQLPRGTYVLSSELLRLAWKESGEARRDHADVADEAIEAGSEADADAGAEAQRAFWVVTERAAGTLTLHPPERDSPPGHSGFWAHGNALTEPESNPVSLRLGHAAEAAAATTTTAAATATAIPTPTGTPSRTSNPTGTPTVTLLWKRVGRAEHRFHPLRVVHAEVTTEVQRFVLCARRAPSGSAERELPSTLAFEPPDEATNGDAERDKMELECTLLYE